MHVVCQKLFYTIQKSKHTFLKVTCHAPNYSEIEYASTYSENNIFFDAISLARTIPLSVLPYIRYTLSVWYSYLVLSVYLLQASFLLCFSSLSYAISTGNGGITPTYFTTSSILHIVRSRYCKYRVNISAFFNGMAVYSLVFSGF